MTRQWALLAVLTFLFRNEEWSRSIVCQACQTPSARRSVPGSVPTRSHFSSTTTNTIASSTIAKQTGLSRSTSSFCLQSFIGDDDRPPSLISNNHAPNRKVVDAGVKCNEEPSSSSPSQQHFPQRNKNIFSSTAAALFLVASILVHDPLPAAASSYYALTEEQKTVAEAWRLVDNSFLDRTFNHQDWFQVRQNYVNGKKYKSMEDAHTAIAEMVASLGDPYTRYLNPGQYQSLVDAATGTFAGVGVEISQSKDTSRYIYASDVQPNSPAARGGLRTNDKFRRVGSVDFGAEMNNKAQTVVTGTPDDVAVQLRGPPGSKVSLTMERPDGTTYDVILTREPLTIAAVQSYILPSNTKVGVIRIKNFSGTTADKVKDEWKTLQRKGANILVLDVRGNPGGLLPGGVDTAGLFLNENAPLVYVVNKQGIVDAQATLTKGAFSDDPSSPLIVLVDANTASAAEVMTAALQENGRAVVAGQQTFGKGIVQTVRELSNQQGGVAITVARYETPSHKDINKQGIAVSVDAPVDCPKDDIAACLPPSVFQATAKSAL
jgi:carboxyl-terminal processing protease